MRNLLRPQTNTTGLISSKLYSQDTFYSELFADLQSAKHEVIIESPFITESRIRQLLPVLRKLRKRGLRVIVNTRRPNEHNDAYSLQATEAVHELQQIGVDVLFTVGHHRKLAIIDRKILWEGSLNILSFNDSCEVMRRISSSALAEQMLKFIGIERFI